MPEGDRLSDVVPAFHKIWLLRLYKRQAISLHFNYDCHCQESWHLCLFGILHAQDYYGRTDVGYTPNLNIKS